MTSKKRISRTVLASAVVSALALTLTPVAANAATGTPETLVGFGSTDWSYYRGTTAPAQDWKNGDLPWATGKAPLGFGSSGLGTTVPNNFSTKPLASYFAKDFDLAQVPTGGLKLTTWADDGVVVYVNGTEVTRKNLPTGTVGFSSYATAAPSTSTAKNQKITVTIPEKALRAGENVIAAQVQSNWRATRDLSFDAQVVAPNGVPTAPAPDPAPGDGGSVAGWGEPSWRDEFTYRDAGGSPAVDPTKWNVRDRSDLGLLFDAAVPSRDQVTVDSSGIAHLRADWQSTPTIRPSDQTGPKELWHKTAYMDQRSLKSGNASYSQTYGRWEIRAKVPTGPKTYGALAAFWLRNSQSGEIDIMEAWGYNEKAAPGGQRIDTATTTVHTRTSGSGNEKYIWHHSDYGAATPVWNDFHTYAFEYMPNYAAIIVDGKEIARATPATHPNLWNKEYFGTPMHVRLNLHVGPSAQYWGLPDPNNKSWTQNLDFQVDYVRIWKYNG